jgi:hypothetical protein
MWPFRFQNCFRPTPWISTMLLLCEMGVSGWLRGTMEHSGVTNLVSDSYNANRRTFWQCQRSEARQWSGRTLVGTLGTVVRDLARFFSYAEMFFEFRGATSKRNSGIPRLSRRPSHWGYCARLSDCHVAHSSGARTKRRVCSNSSTSMVSKIWSSLLDFRQSSVSLNCLKASWGTKRRARKYRLEAVSAPPSAVSFSFAPTASSRRHG